MYYVQDYNVLYNNGVLPVTNDDWHFTLHVESTCKTNLTRPLFIDVPVPSQKSEWSCDRGIDFASFCNFSIGAAIDCICVLWRIDLHLFL